MEWANESDDTRNNRSDLLLGAALAVGADTDPNIPASLSDWKDPAYTNRYFLKVIAPGEAGATNLQKEPDVSSVILPIRMISEGGKPAKPQAMLLMAEDGSSHSLQWRQVGSDVEILFRSKPQSRRFCLYTGPLNGEPQRISPTSARNDSTARENARPARGG